MRAAAQGWYEDHVTGDRRRIPIVHFAAARPPLLLCVKLDLTGSGDGCFEANLASLRLREGEDGDYLHFS